MEEIPRNVSEENPGNFAYHQIRFIYLSDSLWWQGKQETDFAARSQYNLCVQSKLSVLSDQLRSKGGGSLRRLFSPGDREDTISCTRCRTILKHDLRLMEQHAGVRR